MKHIRHSKRAIVFLLSFIILSTLSACSQNNSNAFPSQASLEASADKPVSSQSPDEKPLQLSSTPNANENGADREKPLTGDYKMLLYTEAPNQNSTVNIQYPSFSGDDLEGINALIYDKVQSFAKIDTSLFSGDTGLTMDYESSVTLHNSNIISIVFWGSSYADGGAHPASDLIPLNIDLLSLKEITLKDLYTTDEKFEKVFFEKAFFPADPVTSYDEQSFPEMLKLQSPEYQTISPFSTPDAVSCFLKPEGIVLSMPAVHATGSDHFEAQLPYGDIQPFYLPAQDYWKN